MSTMGLFCIILGFLLMVFIIANNLLAKGILMTREQKINIFIDEYSSMTTNEKAQFLNNYINNPQFKSICEIINS